jgi:hypothetical protein
MEDFESVSAAYKAELWADKTVVGIAGLLHEMQDSYSPAHAGAQVWHGEAHESGPDLAAHVWKDFGVRDATTYNTMIQRGSELINSYDRSCGGCIRAIR